MLTRIAVVVAAFAVIVVAGCGDGETVPGLSEEEALEAERDLLQDYYDQMSDLGIDREAATCLSEELNETEGLDDRLPADVRELSESPAFQQRVAEWQASAASECSGGDSELEGRLRITVGLDPE
jgi:hypothetical protein